MNVKKGDRITIEAIGIQVTGKVIYADCWDGHWDIEMIECDIPGGYSHWKQEYDGGSIVKIH